MFTADKLAVAFVGQPFALDSECKVKRSPAGALAQVVDGVLVPDKPGGWRIELGGAQQRIAVYPLEALEHRSIKYKHRVASWPLNEDDAERAHQRPEHDRLGILIAVARHVSDEALDAISANRPLPQLPKNTSLATFGAEVGQ